MFIIIQVSLFEKDEHVNIVRIGHQQRAIDESLLKIGLDDGDDEYRLIDVAGHEVEIVQVTGALTHDVIPPGQYIFNDPVAFLTFVFDLHFVTHANRVGQFEAIEPKLPDNAALYRFAVFQQNLVPTSG